MNENYGVKGPVHRLEQRKLWNVGLEQLPNHESFDVEFSPSGQPLRITNYNMGGAAIGSEQFVYSSSGQTIRSVGFDSAGAKIRGSDFDYRTDGSRIVTTRKTSGDVMSRTVEIYDGDLLLSLAVYDGADRLMKEKSFEYVSGRLTESDSKYYLTDGSINEKWISAFDSQGRITRTHGLKANGQPLGDGKYIYEYDDEGRISKVWSFNDHAAEDVASAVTLHEYSTDDVGNWVERRDFRKFRGDSNWSKRITSRKFIYFPVG
jgi:hypothetical protein